MSIVKSEINRYRNELKKFIKTAEENERVLDCVVIKATAMLKGFKATSLKDVIEKLNAENNMRIENVHTKKELFAWFEDRKKSLILKRGQLNSLIAALSRDGMMDVTYGLPIMCFLRSNDYSEYAILVLSGIKINARKKNTFGELMSEKEMYLLFLEREMSSLIEDGYYVKQENMKDFIVLFSSYLAVYLSDDKFLSHSSDISQMIDMAIMQIVAHCLRKWTGIHLSEMQVKEFSLLVSSMRYKEECGSEVATMRLLNGLLVRHEKFKTGKDVRNGDPKYVLEKYYKDGKAICPCNVAIFRNLLAEAEIELSDEEFNRIFDEMHDMAKNFVTDTFPFDEQVDALYEIIMYDESKRLKAESKHIQKCEKPVLKESPSFVVDEIYDYIENGVVNRLCNIEEFEKLLNKATLTPEKRAEYMAQMRNLWNRNAKKTYDEMISVCRNVMLDEDERSLCEKAKESGLVSALEDIDTVFELVIEGMSTPLEVESAVRERIMDVSDEEMQEFLNILESSILTLRQMLCAEETEVENAPKVIYYTESFKDADGKEVKVPKLLFTLQSQKRDIYNAAYLQFQKLLDGFTTGGYQVLGTQERVFIKGTDFKIAYMFLGDTTLIIDGWRGETSYSQILNLINGGEFKRFIDDAKTNLTKYQSTSVAFTEKIMDELGRDKRVQKRLELKKTEN